MNNAKLGLEESVLKICIKDRKVGSDIACQLRPEVFEDETNRKIFISYKESIIDEKMLDDIAFIASLDDNKCKTYAQEIITDNQGIQENSKIYVEHLIEKYNKRRIKKLADKIKTSADSDSSLADIIASINDETIKISSNSREYEIEDMGKIFTDLEAELGTEAGLSNLVDLGVPELTEFIGKIGLGSLVGIASRPSMGKTALVVEMLKQLSIKSDKRCLVFSLETDRRRFTHRMVSNVTSIPLYRLKEPGFTAAEKAAISATRDTIINSKIRFADVFDTSIEQIAAVSRKEKMKFNDLKYIFIDYMQLVSANGKSTRNEEVGYISRTLKILAKELNCIIVPILQLNRLVENRQDKRPMLSDIRESGSVEQDLDVCLMLYRDEFYTPDTNLKNMIDIIITKNKEGPLGTVKMKVNLACNQFMPLDDFDI